MTGIEDRYADIEVDVLDDAGVRAAIDNALARAGCTWEELQEQAKACSFSSEIEGDPPHPTPTQDHSNSRNHQPHADHHGRWLPDGRSGFDHQQPQPPTTRRPPRAPATKRTAAAATTNHAQTTAGAGALRLAGTVAAMEVRAAPCG